jgi:VWFA-related protein
VTSLLTLISLLLTMFGRPASAPPDVNDVLRKAVDYARAYEASLMDLVAVEHYDQKTMAKLAMALSPAVERHINSDIVMFQDGRLRYPVRCVRNEDGLGAEVPDYAHKEAIAALGNRPNAKAFRRTLNLPTVPLMALYPANLDTYSVRKAGEDKIAGQVTWKIELASKTPEVEPIVITFWIDPNTGAIFRSLVEVHALGMTVGDQLDGAFTLRMTVEYASHKRFGKLLPVSMKEKYEDPVATIEGIAEYTYMPRLISLAPQPAAKSEPEPADTTTLRVSVDVPLVTLDVSVTGDKGSVTDLSSSDFIVEEDGIGQPISHFTPAAVPYNILLLFDWSGSTVAHRDLLRQAASGFVDRLRRDDWVAMGRFTTTLKMEGWTTVQAVAERRISAFTDSLRGNATSLYTSIEQALSGELLSFVGRRRALVVLTDGRDSGFENTFMLQQMGALKQVPVTRESLRYQRLLEIVKQERVPIYIVAVNTFSEELPSDVPQVEAKMAAFHKAVDQRLEQIVQNSGGRVVHAEKYEDVVPLINQISHELSTAYTLGYYSSAGNSPGDHKINVRTKKSGLTVVQSRSGYSIEQ